MIVSINKLRMKIRFQQLKNNFHIRLSNQQLATVGGVLCIGALAYAAYKYLTPGSKGKTPDSAVAEQKSFQQTYRQVIMNVQQCISKYQTLNGQVIKSILQNQYKLAQYQYKSFILKVRNQRRKLIKDKHEYRRLIKTMDAASEQLMEKNLNAILAHFNIEKTNWIETVELWSNDTQENKEEWENLLINLEDELLDSLRNKAKSPLSFKKLSDIFNFKIYILQHLNQSGLDLDSSISADEEPDINSKYALIEKYIQDLVFTKFGVQEQDILYSEEHLSKDDQEKIFTIDDEFTDMMRAAIQGDEEQQQRQENEENQKDKGNDNEEDEGDDWQIGSELNVDQDKQLHESQEIVVDASDGNSNEDSLKKQKQSNVPEQKRDQQEEDQEAQYF